MDETALRDEVTELLRDLIRVDTSNPPGRETAAAVLLKEYLEAAGVECELVAKDPDRANLIARIPGTGEGPVVAFLGHTDVVPADAQDWRFPPFAGHLDEQGYVWGRGAADMKDETATRAVAMATLARSGHRPRGDLLFIAQADEEDGVQDVGLSWLVHERPDIRADYSIDEGGGARLELADGRVAYSVNVGEKAALAAYVTALGEAGHASVPLSGDNAVPHLAVLIERLAAYRTRVVLLPEVERLIELLAGPVNGSLEAALERARGLHPLLDRELPTLLGTTIAPTRLKGSSARNVMPGRATVECDCRVLPGTTPADLEAELRAALGSDHRYELSFPEPVYGGTSSSIDTPLFEVCRRWVDQQDPGAILIPTISTGFTDSHWVRQAFGTVAYGFWPSRHTPLDVYYDGVHNRDERIHRDDLGFALQFHLHAARELGAL